MPKHNGKRKAAMEVVIKQKVFEVAEKILQSHSPQELTVEMIAQKADIPPGTLYHYFKNKADLVAYVIIKILEPMEQDAERIAHSDTPVTEKLRAFIKRNLLFNDKQTDMFALLYKGSSISSMNPIKELAEARNRAQKRLQQIMKEGINQKIFRNVSTAKLMLTFIGIFQSFSSHRMQIRSTRPVEEDVRDVMEMFMHGAASHD